MKKITKEGLLSNIYKDITLWMCTTYTDTVLCSFCLSLLFPSIIAIEECYKGLERDTNNSDLHFTLYKLLKFNSDISLFHLEKAAENNPDKYSFLYFIAGLECYNKGNVREGLKYLWKALEVNPLDKDCYAHLAEIYRKQGKVNTAVKVLKKGLKIYPDNPFYYILMGTAFLNNASIKMALDCFLKVISLDSVKEVNAFLKELALFKAGLCYLMLGNYDKAIEKWSELSISYPSNPRGPYSLGFINEFLGKRNP